MEVSIIVPVYNTSINYLEQCFESIRKQSEQSYEVIIIDDGSRKETADYLNKWEEQDQRFHVIHTPNKGVSAARNRGIKESKGKWITFIDADDYVEQDMIKTVLALAESSQSDIVMWRFDRDYNGILRETSYVGKPEIIFEYNEIQKVERMLLNFYKYADDMQFTFLATTICKLYKSSMIKLNKIAFCENVRNGEDAIFTFEAVHCAKKIIFKDIILYHYRQVAGSASNNNNPKVIESWIQNRNELKRVLTTNGLFDKYKDDYNYHALEVLKILLFTVIIEIKTTRKQIEELNSLMSNQFFGKCIDNLQFNNVYGLKGKAVLFLAKKRKYHLLVLMTKIRALTVK